MNDIIPNTVQLKDHPDIVRNNYESIVGIPLLNDNRIAKTVAIKI